MPEIKTESTRELRRRAEAKFSANEAARSDGVSSGNTQQLLHELQVHQIELEMQNEELQHSQHDLNLLKSRYFDLYDLAPVGYLTLDESGLILEANLSAATLLGVTRSMLVNQPIFQFIRKEDKDAFYLRQRCLESSDPVTDDMRLIRADGVPVWVCLQVRVTQNGEYWITFNDITERKLAENEIQDNERRMTSLFEISQYPFTSEHAFLDHALNEAITLTASSIGYIYFYNEQKRQFTLNSWSKGVMKECSVLEQQAVYDLDNTGIWGEAVRQRKPILLNDYMANNLLKKGIPEGHAPLKRFLTVPILMDGAIVAVVGVANKESKYSDADVVQMTLFMDSVWKITAHRRAEEEKRVFEKQFQQTQKLESLGILAGGIAHDFNNILTVIRCNCTLLHKKPQMLEVLVSEIEIAAQRAADLCRQMLIYAGKAQPVPTNIDMAALVDEMARLLKASISQNAVVIFLSAADIPPIKADPSQIRQVVMNLIINAAEAIGTVQGEIRVSLTQTAISEGQPGRDHLGNPIASGCYLCLEVTDNGCGMDEETRHRIFEPFYTTKFTGRGLGMSAVLGIIKAHNGALQLFSQPDRGTTFNVYLPVESSEFTVAPPRADAAPLPWQGSGTILLVEDEPQIITVTKMLLKVLGFEVVEASNGKEALEVYRKNVACITLVITDVGMPVMDGYELFRELKKLNPELPVIITSGFGDAGITEQISREDMAGVLSKPYSFDQLRNLLMEVVESERGTGAQKSGT